MNGSKLRMDSLRIRDLSVEMTEFTGMSRLNNINKWVFNYLMKGVVRVLKSQIERVATRRVNQVLSQFSLIDALNSVLENVSKQLSNDVVPNKNRIS